MKKKIGILLAIALLAVALAACGSTEPIAPTDPDTPQPTTETGSAGSVTPTGDYTLLTLNGQPPVAGSTITMRLSANGAEGSTGCNDYFAAADALATDGPLFGPVEATEMACMEPEGVMEQEAAFLRAMNAVDTLKQEGDTLIMTGEATELVWAPGMQEPADDDTDEEDGITFSGEYAGTYTLLTINGQPLIDGTTITLQLDDIEEADEPAIGGSAGCNSYGADLLAFAPGEVAFSPIVSTMMACMEPEGIMEQEQAFLQALNNVDALGGDPADTEADLVMVGEGVELRWARDTGGSDDGRLSFAGSLLDSQWQLAELDGEEALFPATLTITAEEFSGSTGCNQYSGSFTIENGNAISLGPAAATEMACAEPEGIMAFEARYLAALDEVTAVEPRDDERFAMLNAQGEPLMVWEPLTITQPAQAPLEGTEWQLTTFINGETASSTIAGTTLTLLMEEGRLSGSAGCNTYNGSYTLEGDSLSGSLSIPPEIATTRMACPDEIMSQEAAFIEVLAAATGYTIEGPTLTLTTDDDRALVFSAP